MQTRHWIGIAYGLGLGGLYALLAGTVNALTFPGLPLMVDWTATAWLAIGCAAGLAILGLIVAWPRAAVWGVVWGAAALAGFVLVSNLLQSAARLEAQFLVLLFALMPVLVMCLPAAGGLRWLINRQIGLLALAPVQRWRGQVGLLAWGLVACVVAASLGRMPRDAEKAVREMDALLQTGREPSGQLYTVFPNWPYLRAHAGLPYGLLERPDTLSTAGYQVQVRYRDGYGLNCVWVVVPGQKPFLRTCEQVGTQ